jgi:hypothetical protein
MVVRLASLLLCFFLLSGTSEGRNSAPVSAKQKVVPLALQYRQKLTQVLENLPSQVADKARAGSRIHRAALPATLPAVSQGRFSYHMVPLRP